MQERFQNRESRQEDVELIKVLKRNVTEKDELLKKAHVSSILYLIDLVLTPKP